MAYLHPGAVPEMDAWNYCTLHLAHLQVTSLGLTQM